MRMRVCVGGINIDGQTGTNLNMQMVSNDVHTEQQGEPNDTHMHSNIVSAIIRRYVACVVVFPVPLVTVLIPPLSSSDSVCVSLCLCLPLLSLSLSVSLSLSRVQVST